MRILVRSRKSPFRVLSGRRTYRHNAIADNVGNLVFSHAAHRLLSVEGNEVVSNRFASRAEDAAQINADYDVFVVPLANAFRPSFRPYLDTLTDLVERLTIPVVVLGVGAQAGTGYDASRLKAMEPSVRRFVGAVLDRSASIGVRGEFTAEYLTGLGFRDVEVIGCPSLFLRGPDLHVDTAPDGLTPESRIALNVSPYVKAMGPITMAAHRRYPHLTYVPQDLRTLGLLLDGDTPEEAGRTSPLPLHESHPLYRQDKIRFFLDPPTWMAFLATRDFSFGTRIHGNICSIVAGTPAVVLAHDSRTLELARYHEIPYRLVKDVPPDVDPARLYAEADYSGLNGGHLRRWEVFSRFLERSGLQHVYRDGRVDPGAAAFDARVAATHYPGPVGPRLQPGLIDDLSVRMRRRARATAAHGARAARAAGVLR